MSVKKLSVLLGVLVVVSMILTACPAPQPQVVEKIVTQVVEKEVKVVETQVVEKQVEVEKVVTQQVEVVKEVAAEDFTTPHPILSDIKVRQAIASLHQPRRVDRLGLSVPHDEEKAELAHGLLTCPRPTGRTRARTRTIRIEPREGRRAAG